MNSIIPFDFETNAVRVAMIDDAPWFVAADVCRVLEHTNSSVALRRLDDDEKGVSKVYTLGGEQTVNVVNESGLYTLILTSNKPAAKRFRKWVTAEVLPTLRREGAYVMPEAEGAPMDSDFMTIPKDDYIAMLTRQNALLVDHNDLLKQIITPKRKPRRPSVPLTNAEKAKIISMCAAGMGVNEIARQTGRSTATISLLKNGFSIINGGNA